MTRFPAGAASIVMSLYFNCLLPALGLALLAGGIVPLSAEEGATQRQVEKPSEEVYDGPDGKKRGNLLKGTEIEELERQGKWVRFRLEGWIWGPSLEGFVEEPAKPAGATGGLQAYTSRIKMLVNEDFGRYYGVHLEPELQRLVLRFKIKELDRAALEKRQMDIQLKLLDILKELEGFAQIRAETNRPDGGGQVGDEIAETSVEMVRLHGTNLEGWKKNSRFSTDGGATWTP